MCVILHWVLYRRIQVYFQMNQLWRWWQPEIHLVLEQAKAQLFTAPETEQSAPEEKPL